MCRFSNLAGSENLHVAYFLHARPEDLQLLSAGCNYHSRSKVVLLQNNEWRWRFAQVDLGLSMLLDFTSRLTETYVQVWHYVTLQRWS